MNDDLEEARAVFVWAVIGLGMFALFALVVL